MTKISATYDTTIFGHLDTKFLTVETDLTAQATLGAHKSLVVTSSTGFLIGSYYQILGSAGEGRDKLQVESIPDGTHIVVVNLPRQYEIGARIGQTLSTFGWGAGSGSFWTTCEIDMVGTANNGGYPAYLNLPLLVKNRVDPNVRDGFYWLQPLLLYGYAGIDDFIGYNQNYILDAPLGVVEDTFDVGRQDSGTAESGTATTLTDTDKAWTPDAWIGKVIIITAGTGVGQTRKITDNDATSVTVATWTTNPDNTSQYVIADECYRCVAAGQFAARESC